MSETRKPPPVINPSMDVGEQLRFLMGTTGLLQEYMGGFRIKIYHTKAFPWEEVLKTLVYRDFKIYVTRHKADIFIEATT